MASPIVTRDAMVQCPHLGKATLKPADTHVKILGQAVLVQSDPPHVVDNCSLMKAPQPQPCTTGMWQKGATHVRAGGQPVVLQSSSGTSVGPQAGPLSVKTVQSKVERHLMHIDFPYQIDGRGRTASCDTDAHIRDLIEQVLLTSPGERVNRPAFGSGLLRLVFAPGGDALAAATETAAQGALQQWLGDLIQVDAVNVESEEATLRVTVQYTVRRTQTRQTAQIVREL